jgi:chondroitin AC lyase
MDITAVGRQIRSGYTVKRGIYLYNNFNLIKTFDKSNSCKYYLSGLNAEKLSCELLGNKSFWRSDYMIHTAAGKYMMSVKTHGPFADKVESINTENLKGAFLNDGVCLIHRTGNEYAEIEPLWNWTMLPGITSDTSLDPSALPVFHTKNTGAFTGQVSNGIIGISSMQYNRLGITAVKSYFFINDMMFALGAGITSKNAGSLITTVNQRLYNNKELITGNKGNLINWLWQDSIAYIFPDAGQQVKTNINFRKSNWNVIDGASDKPIVDSVLSIYLSHVNTDTYTYLVKPGIDVKDTKKLNDQNPVQVLSNSKELQAIRLGNSILAVFYTAGSLKISENNTIQVDQACMLICNNNTGNTTELWVSDPSRKNLGLTVTLNGKDKKISLPQGDLIGSTVYIKNN